ncbi:MAG: hypothetical protein J7578_04010 [Chitinophagaceae bacterium]|nr:hypothetical protein [Chitinophagaceae bacterium]
MAINSNNETQILKTANAELQKISGASIRHSSMTKHKEGNPAAILEIKFRKTRQEFFVEIKNEVREHTIKGWVELVRTKKDQWLLVARYIPAPIKEFLKKHGYNYLEMTGNCFISTDQLFISINDREVKHVLKKPEGKLWKPTGLKFLFVVLDDPGMLASSQRAIAEAAGIALGNISSFLEELRQSGYLVADGKLEKLQHREKLVDRWVEAFHMTLRPKLIRDKFRFISTEKQKAWTEVELPGLYWSGEPGADLYTNFLVPEHFMLYTALPTTELIKDLKLIPDTNGNLAVLDKFWGEWKSETAVPYAAPLLLVYAELKNSLDSRNWELAEKIKSMLLNGN